MTDSPSDDMLELIKCVKLCLQWIKPEPPTRGQWLALGVVCVLVLTLVAGTIFTLGREYSPGRERLLELKAKREEREMKITEEKDKLPERPNLILYDAASSESPTPANTERFARADKLKQFGPTDVTTWLFQEAKHRPYTDSDGVIHDPYP